MEVENIQNLIFLENEYDVLEKSLMHFDDIKDIFKKTAEFITNRFSSKYVIFISDLDKDDVNVLFSTLNEEFIADKINEKIIEIKQNSNSSFSLKMYSSGEFSVPFKMSGHKTGFIIVGERKDNVPYEMELLRSMVPIVRTLGKSLVFVDATKERIEKERLHYAFSKYISPDIVENIVSGKGNLHLGGEKTVLSVIFTDLQKFTDMSESMEAETLVRVLNEYLNEMSQVIISLGGTIDKFEGDAIMAFFGAPKKIKDHAIRCCLSALRMKRMEVLLNEKLISLGLIKTPLVTRIGINTGEVIVGNIGSMQRLDYTIIGSNVNIASRVESANKIYSTKLLISEQTYELVKDFFETRFVDNAVLKGVSEKVPVYELISEKADSIPNYQNYVQVIADDLEDIKDLDEVELVEEVDEI